LRNGFAMVIERDFVMLPLVPAGLFLATMVLADAAVPPAADPLAPAKSGMVQCYEPDRVSRTCRSIAAYRRESDGGWINTATILPDPTQPLTMDIETPVTLRDGAVCGTVRREQALAAKLRYFDRPVPADHALPLLVQITDAMGSAINREICTIYVPVAAGFVARARITGSAAVFPDQRVIWVRPDAGFRVLPRDPANGQSQ